MLSAKSLRIFEVLEMATAAQAAQFIAKIAPIIQTEAKKRGYKVCSPIIAQACLESAFGTSVLGHIHHNYFGMKCGRNWSGASVNMKTKEEYTPGVLTDISANFRKYPDMASGIRGYFDFISTARYANLKDATTPREYLERIKADEYATSSSYVANNMKVVETYNLTQYDGAPVPVEEKPNGNPYKEPTKNIKFGDKGNGVRWCQYMLNLHGAKLIVDGCYGNLTREAVLNFQRSHNLQPDAIVGVRTRAELKRS